MRYISVDWGDGGGEYPIRIHVEIDDEGFETRKIHEFDDGSTQIACEAFFEPETELSYEVSPSNDEIAAERVFDVTPITREHFEEMWQKEYRAYIVRTNQLSGPG